MTNQTTIDLWLWYGPSNYQNVTMQWGYHESFTDHRQALNLCMSRESYKTSKSNLGNWKRIEGEIDLATSNLEFHVSGPVLNWNCMKLDEVGTWRESCPSSSFRRFESFTAQNTPGCSFATVFSVLSSLVSSASLWEKEKVRYDTSLV